MIITIEEESQLGRLTVEIDHGCSLKPSAASFHSWPRSEIAASAGNFQAGRVPSRAWPAAFGCSVLNASGLVAVRCVN